jgi:RNA methyltransferase, TrmH family
MPSQAVLKQIASLKILKYRQKYGQFIVEGRKNVHELIHSKYQVDNLLATAGFLDKNQGFENAEIISDAEYRKLSNFETPPGILGVARTIQYRSEDIDEEASIIIALDKIADPGNLGTIIRTADWFGVNQIIMAEGCTDFYNPKTINATMGSFARCKFIYTDLPKWLIGKNSYGCFLNGINIHQLELVSPVVLVIGSESHGISQNVESVISNRITIPGAGNAESLNASIAAGIAIDNISRILHS